MAEVVHATGEMLEGLIAACDRALKRLLDPDLPGLVDPTLVEHIGAVRGRAAADLAALVAQADA